MYTVVLSAHGNPDRRQNPYECVAPFEVETCDTIKECQLRVREYIETWDIGGGNWTGGDVYLEGKYIGNISYNGRFWEEP